MIIESQVRPSRFKYTIEQPMEIDYFEWDSSTSYTIKEYFEYLEDKRIRFKDEYFSNSELPKDGICQISGNDVRISILWNRIYFADLNDSRYDIFVNNTHSMDWIRILVNYIEQCDEIYKKYGSRIRKGKIK
jgi:hypothetical protein